MIIFGWISLVFLVVEILGTIAKSDMAAGARVLAVVLMCLPTIYIVLTLLRR